MKHYDPAISLLQARRLYFEENGFGADGGYDRAWVDFKLGPVPFPFPNTPPRRLAVKYHDLHHLATGYETTFTGETEISAWEIGSGCASMIAAFYLNLGGMGFGALVAPRKTWSAFVRGRRSRNLYEERFDDALLSMKLRDVRAKLSLDREVAAPGVGDAVAFIAYVAFGLTLGVASLVAFAPLAVVAAPVLHRLAARSRTRHA